LRLFAEVGRVVLEKADPKVGQRLLEKHLNKFRISVRFLTF
jgi:hypothetical protein